MHDFLRHGPNFTSNLIQNSKISLDLVIELRKMHTNQLTTHIEKERNKLIGNEEKVMVRYGKENDTGKDIDKGLGFCKQVRLKSRVKG